MIGSFKLPMAASGSGTGDYLVRFIDYDGTILKEQWVNSGQAATAPNLPTHDLLTFDEWNNNFSNVTGDLDVGATYRTTTGHSYLFLSFTVPHRLTPSLYLNKSTTGVLNIYDNTSGVLLGTSSASGNVTINLTFAAVGDYVIRIECAGAYTFPSYILGNTLKYELILKKLFIGDTIPSIDPFSFQECSSLQSITIPDGVTSIGTYAFNSCYSLQNITIPNGVTSIGTSAFRNCYSLQNIIIPNGVTSIDNYAFYLCSALKSITIPDGVTSVSLGVFGGCSSLQNIIIPNGVTLVGASAFQECSSLQSITIPDGVTSIGTSAFQECSSLQSITIPDSVTLIGNSIFYVCYALQSITIPDGVTSIGTSAFRSCSSLQSITIPDGVTSIGTYAFNSCTKMQEYILETTTPPTLASTNAFTGIISVCKIYVPDASVDAYKAATNWVTYAAYIFPISTRP